jgi:putative sterol carrier protein
MTDATNLFFDGLAERGHEPLLAGVRGVIRFDLREGRRTEHWRVTINRGAIDVSRGDEAADVVVLADRAVFSAIATGEANATAAILRGTAVATGDTDLIVRFQRIFPAPPRKPAA